MRYMLPLAAAIVLGLTANAFAQTDPHHPQGAPAPEAEMPAEKQATPQAPPMNCRDMMSGMMGMMGNMTPQDGSPQMQTMRMMHMMQMTQMMQAMHLQMMQQMQQMQQDLMSPSKTPNKGVSP